MKTWPAAGDVARLIARYERSGRCAGAEVQEVSTVAPAAPATDAAPVTDVDVAHRGRDDGRDLLGMWWNDHVEANEMVELLETGMVPACAGCLQQHLANSKLAGERLELDSIAEAENKMSELSAFLTAILEAAAEEKAKLEADLSAVRAARPEAKDAIAKATALMEIEAAAFSKESADLKTNIAAVSKATDVIAKGIGNTFVQTSSANVSRSFAADKAGMLGANSQELLGFLSGAREPQGWE